MVMAYELLCFGITDREPVLVVVEGGTVRRARPDGYFDDISFLNLLFEFVEVGVRPFVPVLNGLDLLQMVLFKITTHAFVMNYNKLLKHPYINKLHS